MSSRLRSSLLTDQLPEEGSESANDSVELAPQQAKAKHTGKLPWLKVAMHLLRQALEQAGVHISCIWQHWGIEGTAFLLLKIRKTCSRISQAVVLSL